MNISNNNIFDEAIEAYKNGDINTALNILECLKADLEKLVDDRLVRPHTGNLISTLINIGNIYAYSLRINEGENYLLEAESICRKVLDGGKLSLFDIIRFISIQVNIGILKANLKLWDDAELRFKKAEFACMHLIEEGCTIYDIGCIYISVLSQLGTMYLDRKLWDLACAYLCKAEEIYRSVSNKNDNFFGISEDLIDILTKLANSYIEKGDYKKAELTLIKAESESGKLTTHYDNNIRYDNLKKLADLFNVKGVLYVRVDNVLNAITEFNRIDSLFNEINLFNTNLTPLVRIIISAKINKSAVFYVVNSLPEALVAIDEAIQIMEESKYFNSSFIIDISRISDVLFNIVFNGVKNEFLSNIINVFFDRLSVLLLRWHELQPAKVSSDILESLENFWQKWIIVSVEYKDTPLLVRVLSASHGRRQIELQNAYLMTAKNLSPELRQFVDLKKQLYNLELEQLLPMEQLFNRGNAPPHLIHEYTTLIEAHRQLLNEWLHYRSKLIECGCCPDVQLRIGVDQLQKYLEHDECLLLAVSLKSFGIHDKPPYLLLLRRDGADWIESPELESIGQTIQILNNIRAGRGARHLLLRQSTSVASITQEADDQDEYQLLERLKDDMRYFWQRVGLNSINNLSVIGHGDLHALAWQDSCPVQQNSFFPGLHAYLQRKKTMSLALPMPSSACPVHILAYAAEDKLEDRLYYIPAEIDAIRAVWGDAAVRVITDLDEFSNVGYLFLLGHGNFDKETGNARFMLKDRHVEAHELLTLRPKLLGLGASACLLGQTRDIASEPLGLFSLCANRPDLQFSYGSILPVNDFSALLLSLHFHYQWRRQSSPHTAMRLALAALKSGQWPEETREIFITVMIRQMPVLFRALEDDSAAARGNKVIEQRIKNVKYQWMCNRGDYIRHYKTILDNRNSAEQKREAAVKLVEGLLERLLMQQPGANFGDFSPFWLYG